MRTLKISKINSIRFIKAENVSKDWVIENRKAIDDSVLEAKKVFYRPIKYFNAMNDPNRYKPFEQLDEQQQNAILTTESENSDDWILLTVYQSLETIKSNLDVDIDLLSSKKLFGLKRSKETLDFFIDMFKKDPTQYSENLQKKESYSNNLKEKEARITNIRDQFLREANLVEYYKKALKIEPSKYSQHLSTLMSVLKTKGKFGSQQQIDDFIHEVDKLMAKYQTQRTPEQEDRIKKMKEMLSRIK